MSDRDYEAAEKEMEGLYGEIARLRGEWDKTRKIMNKNASIAMRYHEALRLAKATACSCNLQDDGNKCPLCRSMESAGIPSDAAYWRGEGGPDAT